MTGTTDFLALIENIDFSLIGSLAVGAVLCFFGLRLFYGSVVLLGGLLGAVAGYSIGYSLFDMWGGVAGLFILGILCACVLRALVRIGGFLGCFLIGGLVGASILGDSLWVPVIGVVSGVIGIVFVPHFIMAATSLMGAVLVSRGVSLFSPLLQGQEFFFVTVIVFIIGFMFQTVMRRRKHA